MRLLKGLIWATLGLAGLIGVLLVTAFHIDYSKLKPRVEILASEFLGRELTIEGPLTLELDVRHGLNLNATKARLAAPDWAARPLLASLEHLEIQLRWQDLLQSPIVIHDARAEGLAVFLEQDDQGRNNWTFDFAGEPEQSHPTPDKAFEMPVMPRLIQASDSRLEFREPDLLKPVELELHSLVGRSLDSGAFEFQTGGRLNEETLLVDIGVDASSDMVRLQQMRMDWWANLGEISLRGNIDVAELLAPRRPELNLRLQGPNFEYLTDLLNMQRITTGPLKLDLSFEPKADHMALQLDGVAGEFEIQADGFFQDIRKLERAQLTLSANGPSAAHVGNLLGIEHLAPEPFELEATASRTGPEIRLEAARLQIASTTIEANASLPNYPEPEDAKVQLRIQGQALEAHGAMLGLEEQLAGPFQGQVDVWPGADQSADLTGWLTVDRLKIRVSGRGNITGNEGYTSSTLEWRISMDDMATAARAMGVGTAPALPLLAAGDLSLTAEGLLLENGTANIGENSNTLSASVSLPLDKPGARIAAAIKGDSLAMLVPDGPAKGEFDHPFKAEVAISVLEQGWQIERAILQSDKADLSVKGQLGEAPDYLGTGLDGSINLSSLARFNTLLDQDLPDLPLQAEATVAQSEGRLTFRKLKASVGTSSVTGKLYIIPGDTPHIAARLNSNYVDLTPFLPERVEEAPAEPERRRTPRQRSNKRVIPDTPIDLSVLKAVTADVGLNVKTLQIEAQTVSDVILEATIKDGILRIPKVEIVAPRGGWMRGNLYAKDSDQAPHLSGRLIGENMTLGLPAKDGQEIDKLPRYDLKLGFISEGRTTRELAASLDGFIRIESGKGKLRTGALRMFTGDFASELLSTLNPMVQQDPYSNVDCVTLFAAVEDGQLEGKPAVVLQTERLRILADTNVNLDNEKLTAYFQTTPQKGLGFSFSSLVNPYVMVTGTLGSPQLTLDPEGALIQGGAAVATAGLSILAKGFKDRFFSSKDPCGQALMDADVRVQELEVKYASERTSRPPL